MDNANQDSGCRSLDRAKEQLHFVLVFPVVCMLRKLFGPVELFLARVGLRFLCRLQRTKKQSYEEFFGS